MLSIPAFVCSALLVGVALAQAPTTNFTQNDLDRIIHNVSLTDRNSWCIAQQGSCSNLCGGSATQECHGDTLMYNCTCNANKSAPALAYYSPTMPSFICNATLGYCLADHASDAPAQDNCKKTYICGGQNATEAGAQATSSATASGSASATGSATGTSSPAATSSRAAAAALRVGEQYGVGLVGAALLAAFGLAL